ncbi:MAG: metal ABC transporter substrate-binding protein [Rhodobacter sp.]|nr:metal ABC transporter substrate-binding protein [Rhodobacter sp.]
MRHILTILLLLAAPAKAEVPNVVTDIAPVHSLATQVLGDLGTPVLLLDPGADPHHFQLRPSQARTLSRADVVIWVGKGLTPWLDDVIGNLGKDPINLELLDVPDLPLRVAPEAGFGHGDADPHAWLDPLNAAHFLAAIAGALASADPDNAPTYRANAARAAADLQALTRQTEKQLQAAPVTMLIAYHDAYRYFLTRFDLDVSGSLTDSDAQAPSAARLADLRGILATEQNACLLAEPDANPALIAALAQNRSLRVATLDALGRDLAPGPGLYPELIRAMAQALSDCMAR